MHCVYLSRSAMRAPTVEDRTERRPKKMRRRRRPIKSIGRRLHVSRRHTTVIEWFLDAELAEIHGPCIAGIQRQQQQQQQQQHWSGLKANHRKRITSRRDSCAARLPAHSEWGSLEPAMRRRILEPTGRAARAGSGVATNFRVLRTVEQSGPSCVRAKHKQHPASDTASRPATMANRKLAAAALLVVVVVCLDQLYSLAALASLHPAASASQQVSGAVFWKPPLDIDTTRQPNLELESTRRLASAANQSSLKVADYTFPADEDEFPADYADTAELAASGKSPLLNFQLPQLNHSNSNHSTTTSTATTSTRAQTTQLAPTTGSQPTQDSNLILTLFSAIDRQWSVPEVILVIVTSAILNLVTIVGNIMVLISFKMDRSLQTVSNYFLLSLAMADLLIGLISMPLYTLYLLLNRWPLGQLMCDIWLAIDYLNSNAAVLNMLVISFDRYFSVTRPLTYRAKRTTKHACLMILSAWILSLTIWTPAIFTYPYYKGRTVQGTDKCEIEFVKANTYLTFVTAILAFYIPAIIMIYLYWRIWLETKKRYRDLTTLFLVSGAGAAAPARPARPLPAPSSKRPKSQQQQQQPVIAAVALAHKQQTADPKTPSEATQVAAPRQLLHHDDLSGPPKRLPNKGPEAARPASPVKCRWPAEQPLQGAPAAPGKLPEARQKCCYGGCTGPGLELECLGCLKCELSGAAGFFRPTKLTSSATGNQQHDEPQQQQQQEEELNGARSAGTPTQAATNRLGVSQAQQAKLSLHVARHQHCHRHAVSPAQACARHRERREHREHREHRHHHHHCHRHRHRHHLHHNHQHHQHHGHSHNRTGATPTSSHPQHAHQCRPSAAPACLCCTPARHRNNTHGHLTHLRHTDEQPAGAGSGSMQPKVHPTSARAHEAAAANNTTTRTAYINQCHPVPKELAGINFAGSSAASSRPQSQASSHERQQPPLVLAATDLEAAANQLLLAPLSTAAASHQSPESRAHAHTPDAGASPDDDDDDDERDCETRIVSAGDCFRFESEALMRPRPGARRAGTRECCSVGGHCLSATTAKQCLDTHNNRCCNEQAALLPDCRMCRQRTGTSLTCRYLCGSPRSCTRRRWPPGGATPPPATSGGCRKCQRQHSSSYSSALVEASATRPQESRLATVPDSSLGPKVVGANLAHHQHQHQTTHLAADLKQDSTSSEERQQQPQKTASSQAAKRFSRKLTFNEILVAEQGVGAGNEGAQNGGQHVAAQHSAPPGDQHSPEARFSWWSLRRLRGSSCWLKQLLCPSYKQMNTLHQVDTEEASRSKSNHLLGGGQLAEGGATSRWRRRRIPRCCWWYYYCCCCCCCRTYSCLRDSARLTRFSSKESLSQKNSRASSDSDNNNNNNYNQLNSSSSKSSYYPTSHHPIQPKSERKAAKTLSTLLLVFIVTWLPYNVLVLIKTLSGGEEQVPEKVWNFSYYLCYINSTINPLCYALCNAQFRRTYMRILKCKLSDEHNTKRRMGPLLSSSSNWNKQLQPSDLASRSNSDNQQQHHEQQSLNFRPSRHPPKQQQQQSTTGRHLRHS